MNSRTHSPVFDELFVTIPETVLFQDLGNETIILDVGSGEFYGTNEVGSRMWNLFHAGACLGEVVGTLLDEYEVPEDRLRSELRHFIDQLQGKGLITVNARLIK